MIIKPFEDGVERDPRRRAGRSAERQVAHYLDRYFGKHETIHVLHDLRLEFEADRAQIDHLVLHSFGAAIIESKSVSTSVRINAANEWERLWEGAWKGMPDPLLQGERQALLLKRILTSRTNELLDKLILGMLQGTFRFMALDVFAAISDEGTIRRSDKRQASRATKADAIPGAIQRQIDGYLKAAHMLNPNLKTFSEAPRAFKDAEVLRIARFLCAFGGHMSKSQDGQLTAASKDPSRDTAGSTPPAETPIAIVRAPTSDVVTIRLACQRCRGRALERKIGRYGPYGRCSACSANTAVRVRCEPCGRDVYVERWEHGFAGGCDGCGRRYEVRVGAD